MERKRSKEYGWKAKISSYESCLQRTLSLFSLWRRACPVLKHNRVSEVFKGLKIHEFEHYGQRNYVLNWKLKFAIYFLANDVTLVTSHGYCQSLKINDRRCTYVRCLSYDL